MEEEIRRIHRSTSMILRKRRDQAKKEFLQNRRSGHYPDVLQDDPTFTSMNFCSLVEDPIKPTMLTSGPRSLGCLNTTQTSRNNRGKSKGRENELLKDEKLWRKNGDSKQTKRSKENDFQKTRRQTVDPMTDR